MKGRDLASLLNSPGADVQLRQGVVQSLSTGPSRVTVRLGGSTVDIAGVRYLASYGPAIGDTVWIVVDGPSLLVLGRVAATDELGVRYARFNGTLDGAGDASPVHGLGGDLPRRLVSVQGWWKGNSGEAIDVGKVTVDGSNLYVNETDPAAANRSYYVVVAFTETAVTTW